MLPNRPAGCPWQNTARPSKRPRRPQARGCRVWRQPLGHAGRASGL